MLSHHDENDSSAMQDPTTGPQSHFTAGADYRSAPEIKATVVGLYGVPGCGKTFLLEQLKQELGEDHFAFYEGSEKIATLVPGGLDAFRKLDEPEKVQWRQLAIGSIGRECAVRGRVGVVTGHFMFWPQEKKAGQTVHTQTDLDTFSHILYLDVPEQIILQRHLDDLDRLRPSIRVPTWANGSRSRRLSCEIFAAVVAFYFRSSLGIRPC